MGLLSGVKVTSHEDSEGGWNVGLPSLLLAFGTTRMAELSAVCAGHILPQRKFLISVKG